MKVVILAGGLGSRLSEETQLKPKPMVEIGPYPILVHIMMHYSQYRLNDFVVCLGYKGYVIKEYFANFVLHRSNVVIDVGNNRIEYLGSNGLPPWRVALIDTGTSTNTGGRLRRVAPLLSADEPFCMTYGDGLSDVDLGALIAFHKMTGLDATLTAVRPPGRFGATVIEGYKVLKFTEKPPGEGGYINGGFFVLRPRVIERIKSDSTSWETEALASLAYDGNLAAYVHDGFWHPMDTLRDKKYLEELWATGSPPWKR